MTDEHRALVERLFEAFNRRDADAIAALCHEDMEFFAITAEAVGRPDPYIGPAGLHDYLEDVAGVWEELLITPQRVRDAGERILVEGRVYLRGREFGIRDMPAAWIWEVRDGLFARGEVFVDPGEATRRFDPEPSRLG